MKFWRVMSAIFDILLVAAFVMGGCCWLSAVGATKVFGNEALDGFLITKIGNGLIEYCSNVGINAQMIAIAGFALLVLAVFTWIVTAAKSSSYEDGIATGAIAYHRGHHRHHGHTHELGETVVSSSGATTEATEAKTDESESEEDSTMTLKEKIAAKKAAKAAKKAEKAAAKEAAKAAKKAEKAAAKETKIAAKVEVKAEVKSGSMDDLLKNLKK